MGKWDVCLVGPQLVFAVDSIHQQLNIPVASIEPRAYAMADGAAAIEMAKNYWGKYGLTLNKYHKLLCRSSHIPV